MIRLLEGDCRVVLPTLAADSVQSVITSPPYYGLRDYGTEPLVWGGDAEHEHEWMSEHIAIDNRTTSGLNVWKGRPGNGVWDQPRTSTALRSFCPCGAWLGSLGLEPTPELYIEHMVEVFREVRRVLRDDGVCFLNLGDSYAGKNLLMMPFRVAMALQADGWWLRSVIPWLKRNAMPESVTDRPATSVEYVFLLAKSARYYWDADAVRQPIAQGTQRIIDGGWTRNVAPKNDASRNDADNWQGDSYAATVNQAGRNRRNSDWFFESWQGLLLDEQDESVALIVNPAPFKQSHFATFPPKLVEPMVKASTSEKGQCPECGAPWVRTISATKYEPPVVVPGERNVDMSRGDKVRKLDGKSAEWRESANSRTTTGWRPTCKHDAEPVPQTILDPFGGSGTVGLVADRLGRNAVLCELKPSYAEMGTARIVGDAPMFAEVDGPRGSVAESVTDKQAALGKRTYSGFNTRWDARGPPREHRAGCAAGDGIVCMTYLYLLKRGPRPEWHKAEFHPLVMFDRQPVAMREAMTLDEGSWLWMRFGSDAYAGGWQLCIWEGLVVENSKYQPTGRHKPLPDGTHTGFFHERDKEPWTLISQCICWSPRAVPQWLADQGVNQPTDAWTLQKIS